MAARLKKVKKKLRLVAGVMLKPVIRDREKTRTLLFSMLNVCHHIWASRQVGILLFYGVTPKDARSRPRSRLPCPFRRPRLDCVEHNGLISEHKPICKAFRVGQVSLTFGWLELQLSVGAVLAENVATWTSLLIKSTWRGRDARTLYFSSVVALVWTKYANSTCSGQRPGSFSTCEALGVLSHMVQTGVNSQLHRLVYVKSFAHLLRKGTMLLDI